MGEWKEIKLIELCTFQRGHDLPKTEMKGGAYPVAGSNSVIGFHNKNTTKGPSLTIGRSGNIGTPYYFSCDFWAHNTVLYVKDFHGNNPKFAYYLLKTIDFSQYNAGSAVPTLNRNHIHEHEVFLPPLPEQERIAEVLSSLDDKIDLLHKQNRTLEEMAETLYRQWFVEEENPQEIIGKVIKTTSGGTPSRTNESYYKGIIPWVKSKELNNSFILSTEEFISEGGLRNSSAKLLQPYTVMIAMYGATIGEIGIIEKVSTCNQAICAIEPNIDFPFTFIYQYFKSIKSDLINLAVGGAQQNISQDLIKGLEIPVDHGKIIKYHETVLPFYDKVLSNAQQIQHLENLRDTLLPKLMSGLVTVNEIA